MIVIAGTIDLTNPGDRDACIAASLPLQLSTRNDEPGCTAYCFGADPVVAGRIQVVECWADEASLAAHFAHPNFTGMKAMLASFPRDVSHVTKYRVDLAEPVYDADRRPRADFFTAEPAILGEES
jgi:quinol monooxygenase YgiN